MPMAAKHEEMEKKQEDLASKVTILTEQIMKVQEGLERRDQTRGRGAESTMAARLFPGRTRDVEREVARETESVRGG